MARCANHGAGRPRGSLPLRRPTCLGSDCPPAARSIMSARLLLCSTALVLTLCHRRHSAPRCNIQPQPPSEPRRRATPGVRGLRAGLRSAVRQRIRSRRARGSGRSSAASAGEPRTQGRRDGRVEVHHQAPCHDLLAARLRAGDPRSPGGGGVAASLADPPRRQPWGRERANQDGGHGVQRATGAKIHAWICAPCCPSQLSPSPLQRLALLELRAVHPADGCWPLDDPRQSDARDTTEVRLGRWRLTPRADYDITARILSRADYRFDALADLIPEDLALGLGPDVRQPAAG
mgnify:CR=1 FL=1